MQNPMLSRLNSPTTNSISGVRQMYQAYRMAQNPAAALQTMATQNPLVAQLAGSGNLKNKFYQMCNEKGVDPDSILNQLQ